MAAGVQVQHEADERPLQARAPILEDVEARPGDLHAPVEVQDAPARARIPVRLGREGETALDAFFAHHAVFAVVFSDGNRRVGQVGQLKQLLFESLFLPGQLSGQRFNVLLERRGLGLGFFAGRRRGRLADLARQAVLVGL